MHTAPVSETNQQKDLHEYKVIDRRWLSQLQKSIIGSEEKELIQKIGVVWQAPELAYCLLETYVFSAREDLTSKRDTFRRAAEESLQASEDAKRVQRYLLKRYPPSGDFLADLWVNRQSDARRMQAIAERAVKRAVAYRKRLITARGRGRDEKPIVGLCLFALKLNRNWSYSVIAELLRKAFQAKDDLYPPAVGKKNQEHKEWRANGIRALVRRFAEEHSTDYQKMRELFGLPPARKKNS